MAVAELNRDLLCRRDGEEGQPDKGFLSRVQKHPAPSPGRGNLEAKRFLQDLDIILPGAFDAATRINTQGKEEFLADLKHWPSDPLNKGSYVSNHPGYFTTIAEIEGLPVDNLYFAGEHTDSFYEWQGYMEGAANSGMRAADEILSDLQLCRARPSECVF